MKEDKEKSSLDILGIKPIATAIDKTVETSLNGVTTFLNLVCAPALGELGFLIQDKVKYWRLSNVIKMLEKAKGKIEYKDEKLQVKAHPRVAISIIENSSYIDNDEILEMWAGLFSSSCIEDGQDDENLIFVDILKRLTSAQGIILRYVIKNCRKVLHTNGLVTAEDFTMHCDEIKKLTQIENIHRIDRELDYLSALGLIHGGFDSMESDLVAEVTPSYLALSLFVRCHGSSLNPDEFWKDTLVTIEELEAKEAEEAKIEAEKRLLQEMKPEINKVQNGK